MPLNSQTLAILQQLKAHQSAVSVGVDTKTNNLHIDRPFPMTDVDIPLKPGQAENAQVVVRDLTEKFSKGIDPDVKDADGVLAVIDMGAYFKKMR